jgi:hypothetical protein
VKRFENPNAPIILLKALKSLCDVDATLDNYQAYACLKNMKHPDNSKSSNGSGSDKDSPKSETVKRSRSELSIVIMQQLTQPLSTTGIVPLTNFSEMQYDFTVSLLLTGRKLFMTNIDFSFIYRNYSERKLWICLNLSMQTMSS